MTFGFWVQGLGLLKLLGDPARFRVQGLEPEARDPLKTEPHAPFMTITIFVRDCTIYCCCSVYCHSHDYVDGEDGGDMY